MALRWGVVGAGKICHDFVVSFWTIPSVEHQIIAVASERVGAAETFARELGIGEYYESYDDMFQNEKIDVVYIGLINTKHFEVSKMALKSGKHVLCEKPMCLTLKETKELVAYSKERKLFLMEGLWSRFLPAYEIVKQEIEKNTIGTVLQLIASFGTLCEDVDRIKLKDLGGGSVLDRGCYCIQLACLIFGGERPDEIICGGHLNEESVDMSSSTTLTYAGGRTATLLTHCQVNLPNDAYIIGTKGTIKIAAPFWKPRAVQTPSQEYTFESPVVGRPTIFWNSSGLAFQIREVRRCILGGLCESPGVSHKDSVLIAEISAAVRAKLLGTKIANV